MRRRSHARGSARRRRQMLWALGALCLLAASLTQCTSGSKSTRSETARVQQGSSPGYRSVAGDSQTGDKQTGEQTGSERLMPANHEVDWLQRHGTIARTDPGECSDCHQEEDCSSCHTENLSKPFRVHPPNYETVHAVDARMDMHNCSDCHKAETFCAECHVRTRFSAAEPHDPAPRFEFHPPDWIDDSSPNNHGVAARRNIVECASCHQERDCVTCHQSINPHPPEFRMNCRSWLDADARACAKCHGDVERLRGMCL